MSTYRTIIRRVISVFDCSNSTERPSHRGNGGPVENDIVGYLKQYASHYGFWFVDNLTHADIIFTNDVFPQECLKSNKPKVKRMDGIFWQTALQGRNNPLNQAAQSADHVIFVSEYSRRAYEAMCGIPLKATSVTLNRADPKIFYPTNGGFINKPLLASATSWGRPEKRGADILEFAKITGEKIVLIGESNITDENIICAGYIKTPQEIATIMQKCRGFVNLSFRDAAPKVVAQAVATRLPVIYANSGGVPEMVADCGVDILDEGLEFDVRQDVPRLNPQEIQKAMQTFNDCYDAIKTKGMKRDIQGEFEKMLGHYFDAMRQLV